jgi:hypothetical protein
MLVGDIIITVRELIPDPAPLLTQVPTNTSTVVSVVGSQMPSGTYATVVTQTTAAGETIQSAEVTGLVVGTNQGIQAVTTPLPGATGMRIYITGPNGASGSESYWTSALYATTLGLPGYVIISTLGTPGIPPVRSTAYVPDQDGQTFAAGTLFRWLTLGLREISQTVGGLPNYSGVQSVIGQPNYVVQGEWNKITDLWYDGWPMTLGNRQGFFKRNTVQSSVLDAGTLAVMDNRIIIENWPQPARTGGSTTLTAAIAATDILAPVVSTAGWLLPFGLAQIGNEIVSYSNLAGTSIGGLVRSLSGTLAQGWPSGTVVNELNLTFHGSLIVTTQYTPGTSTSLLPIPSGWDSMLSWYMLARARAAEGDAQGSQQAMQAYQSQVQMWARTNRQLAGPVQISQHGGEFTVFGGTNFGRFVIP